MRIIISSNIYIANILYALVLRHISRIVLVVIVLTAAVFTLRHGLSNPNGDFMRMEH